MTPQLNVFYGILTNGDNTRRKTTGITPKENTVQDIVTALIPSSVSAECKRALAELYIRIIQTDKSMQLSLKTIDPINSYKLQTFRENFSDQGILDKIIQQLQALGLPDEENSSLPFDYIKNALRILLDKLNDLT